MDSLVKLLLNALNVATMCRGPQLIVLPPEDILATVLAGSPLAEEQEQIARIIVTVAGGQISTAAGLPHLLDMVQRCEPEDSQLAPFKDRRRAAATLDQLLMLNALLDHNCALHSSLVFDDSAMFDFIQSLTIEPAAGSPATVLAAQIAARSGEMPLTMDSALLRRITVTYRRDTLYPALTVKIPSTTPGAPRQGTRLNWEQRDTHADDLNLYNFNHRPLGQIITRRARPPYEIHGRKLALLFPAHSDVEFLVTDVIDTENAVLGRYVRLMPSYVNTRTSST